MNQLGRVLMLNALILLPDNKMQCGIATFKDYMQSIVEDMNDYYIYYKPSLHIGGMLLTSSLLLHKFPRLYLAAWGTTSGYACFLWYKGMREINGMQKKYAPILKGPDNWTLNKSNEAAWTFAHWRKFDVYGDALYWPTAESMKHYHQIIVETIIRDIYNRRLIIKIAGDVINFPSPEQIAYAIHQEIDMLNADQKILKKYTNIYRKNAAFVPDTTHMRIFWPNYNRASRLYIEMVTIVERLEVLQDIIALLRINGGGNNWPPIA